MASGRIFINEERCKGCGLCLKACPPGVLRLADNINSLGYRPAAFYDPEFLCTGCALCAMVCPDAGITVFRNVPQARPRQIAMEGV